MPLTTRRSALRLGTTAFATLAVGSLASKSHARDIEIPRYEVVSVHEDFEVRRYASRLVAQVEVVGKSKDATNAGFRILADYIFGNNTTRDAIAMTAPVDRQAASEAIAMTAPVGRQQAQAEDRWVVTFTMPREYTDETLPRPNDERVKIRRIPVSHVAAVKFSGAPGEGWVERKMTSLEEAVRTEGLQTAGRPATYARYDPPWTLPFLRRNEILLDLVVDEPA